MAARVLCSTFCLGALAAQAPEFLPGTRYDPALPTLRQVVGHDFGEDISSHADVERYARALAAASPRVRVADYGRSWQGRTLLYLVLGSERNLARLESVRAGMAALADPRGLQSDAEAQLVRDLPAVVWLAYTVHGDEISGSAHIMGTLRLGPDPRTSVTDSSGRCHDVGNLFCADGALFPTSSGAYATPRTLRQLAR